MEGSNHSVRFLVVICVLNVSLQRVCYKGLQYLCMYMVERSQTLPSCMTMKGNRRKPTIRKHILHNHFNHHLYNFSNCCGFFRCRRLRISWAWHRSSMGKRSKPTIMAWRYRPQVIEISTRVGGENLKKLHKTHKTHNHGTSAEHLLGLEGCIMNDPSIQLHPKCWPGFEVNLISITQIESHNALRQKNKQSLQCLGKLSEKPNESPQLVGPGHPHNHLRWNAQISKRNRVNYHSMKKNNQIPVNLTKTNNCSMSLRFSTIKVYTWLFLHKYPLNTF